MTNNELRERIENMRNIYQQLLENELHAEDSTASVAVHQKATIEAFNWVLQQLDAE